MTRKTEPLVDVEEVRRRANNAPDPQRCGLTDEIIREFMATLSDDPGEDGLIRENCVKALAPKPQGLTVLWYAAHVAVEAAMRARTTRTSRPHIRVPGERTAQLPPEIIPTLPPVGLATVPELTPLPLPRPPRVGVLGPLLDGVRTGPPHAWAGPCECRRCREEVIYTPIFVDADP